MRILFVAMPNSIHTAKWIKQLKHTDWDVSLFPSLPADLHPSLAEWTSKSYSFTPSSLRKSKTHLLPFPGLVSSRLIQRAYHELFGPSWRIQWLARTIRHYKPDIIHSLEFQNAGYACLQVKALLQDRFPTWIATNWGSDIHFYQQLDGHRQAIQSILTQAEFYSAECRRDYKIAQDLGMTATSLPSIPNTGGFDLEKIAILRKIIPVAARKTILIKGYQGMFGRALNILTALNRIPSQLQNYHIVIYSSVPEVTAQAEILSKKLNLSIECLSHTAPLPHDKMIDLFSRSRLYIGNSVSDGISTSMLEAMALGTFPIQSCTACADEWIQDGLSGYIVSPDDIDGIAESIESALKKDELVEKAADRNWETIKNRCDAKRLRQTALTYYETAFESHTHKGKK